MTVSLTNTSGRCQVFVLTHETYCRTRGACACDVGTGREGRRTPGSLTLASGVTSADLDDAVLAIPEVVRAARCGELTVMRQIVEPPRPAAAPVSTTHAPTLTPPDVNKAKKKRGAG